jgi:predicted MPP superfamily phosphohydrolase
MVGVDDLTAIHRSGQDGDPISKALAGRPQGATILLSHTPWQADKALLEGRYEVDGMTVIVCRGTGTWGPRMRLWRPSEILRLKLQTGRKQDTSK